jgi:hypothetical protein
MSTASYPQIQKLIDCINEHDLKFEVVKPTQINQYGLYDEQVKMIYKDLEFNIPVDNEYSDVELGNPVVFLDMILREVEHFEESENIMEWVEMVAEQLEDPETQQFYTILEIIVPEIRSIVGNNMGAIPYNDIELNTGLAKALRAAKID